MDDVAKKEGRTVLFVSHNMGAIKELCSKAVYISKGRIIKSGVVGDVIDQYIKETSSSDPRYISKIKDRTGNGKVRVKKISITNQDGDTAISCFDKLKISVSLSSLSSVSRIQLKIPVIDAASDVLFRIDTDNIEVNKLKSSTIEIETGELNLIPTTCLLNIGVFADSELADYIKDVYTFDILRKRKQGVKIYNSEDCRVLIPNKVLGMD